MVILLHSSKTMLAPNQGDALRSPQLIEQAEQLNAYLKTLDAAILAKVMGISASLAAETHAKIAAWTADPKQQSLAIDSFVGDIYSGLQVNELTAVDRDYADQVLRILSGLYGIIRPLDGISPYRLEMAYRLPDPKFANLYQFWGKRIAECLPSDGLIVNLASVEYSKTVTPYVDAARVVAPKFLTMDPKSGEPKFVVVHAKIARGAFARWLIQKRLTDRAKLPEFAEIGYKFNQELSTTAEPAFVCQTFKGTGLSVRLR